MVHIMVQDIIGQKRWNGSLATTITLLLLSTMAAAYKRSYIVNYLFKALKHSAFTSNTIYMLNCINVYKALRYIARINLNIVFLDFNIWTKRKFV